MRATTIFLTALTLVFTLATSEGGDNHQVTPCFIPIRDLAFTELVETLIPTTTVSDESCDHVQDSDAVTQPPRTATGPNSNEHMLNKTSSTSTTFNAEDASPDILSRDTSSTLTDTTVSDPDPAPTEGANPPILDESGAKAAETAAETSETALTEVIQLPTSMTTTQVTLCIPYCAAVDGRDRCVVIKGCGYPDGGSFGRHGCCPPGYYTGAEVLGLLMFVAIVLLTAMCKLG